ncbi:hypothetical protein IWX49DRAFT_433092 [Phyllosticta citricarpa]|uniref:Uncharacterized protein n=1 Tax=Phyllosticta paracitricarpa TaxID=2016321 RepID=A0ABR1NIA2_9PEZI
MDGWQMDGRLGPGDVDPVARAAGRGESQVKSEEAMGDIPAASANKKLRDDARPVPWRCVCHGRCNEDVQVLPARHSAYGSNARSPTVAAWRGEAWGLEADLISLTTIICTAMSVEHLRHNFEISINASAPFRPASFAFLAIPVHSHPPFSDTPQILHARVHKRIGIRKSHHRASSLCRGCATHLVATSLPSPPASKMIRSISRKHESIKTAPSGGHLLRFTVWASQNNWTLTDGPG